MPFAQVRDIRTYYEIRGSGPRLLYISGTGGDLRQTPSIFESPLAEHFEILAYDQRGLGQTDRPDKPYTMRDYAEDASALLNAVDWQSCIVMGVSFGGMVAQEFAVRYPGRVERLVLACTSSGGEGGSSYPLHEFIALSSLERAKKTIPINDRRCDDNWQSANPELFQILIDQALARAAVGADEPGRASGARRQLEARIGHDTYDRLPSLPMPVYICGGQYDGIAPAENQYAMKRQIERSLLDLFEGGHGFLRQDPRAYPSVISFLLGQWDGKLPVF